MRVLFLVPRFFLAEPSGVLQLSAILKGDGHETKLLALKKHSLKKALDQYDPQIIAYSAMSTDATMFRKADSVIRTWADENTKRILRIMGGPHPTYFPEVLEEMKLDAICIGEGDHAIREMVRKYADGEPLSNIPNVLTELNHIDGMDKEIVGDLDSLPFLDRDVFYEAMPIYRHLSFRGFMTSRGCPYDCTYCHNHAFRQIFRDCGNLLRRQSVDRVIEEIKYVVKTYPPVRLIRITDDTFAHRIDDWLLEFVERYPKEIGLPFYCLMRSNTLTEEMAKLLSSAGCVSISMAVESGDERIRNEVLGRNLSDTVVVNSFKNARKYGIKTYGNTILAIPGTRFEDDFESFLFTKKLRLTIPTFTIFSPYPRTELTEYAIRHAYLDPTYGGEHVFFSRSPLNYLTQKEKDMQMALVYLGPLFCAFPDAFIPFLRILLRSRALLTVFRYIGSVYTVLGVGLRVFPQVYPRGPIKLFKLFIHSITGLDK